MGTIDLTLPGGCILGLIGENGAGKSTLIRLILDMTARDSGDVSVLGHDNRAQFRQVKEEIGVVFDEAGVPACLSAVQFGQVLQSAYGRWSQDAYTALLERLGVPQKKPFSELSRGNKMKVSIAAALAHDAKLLLLDEPTNGLDPAGIQEMRALIRNMPAATGATVLISSHLLGEMEQMVEQVGIIDHGHILFEGPLTELQRHSRGNVTLRLLDPAKAAPILRANGLTAHSDSCVVTLPPLQDALLAGPRAKTGCLRRGRCGTDAPHQDAGGDFPEPDERGGGLRWAKHCMRSCKRPAAATIC